MTRLTIVVEVEDVDPTLVDPHDVADALLDDITPTPGYRSEFVSAQWGDMMPEQD